jgi:hypothetical protein
MRILMLCAPLLWALAASAWAQDVVVDNDDGAPGFTTPVAWTLSVSAGWNGTTYVYAGAPGALRTATWRPTLPATANYEVIVAFLASGNRTPRAPYTIVHAGGSTVVEISQLGTGVRELSLGAYPFTAGTAGSVSLSNTGDPGMHIADAVFFRGPDHRLPGARAGVRVRRAGGDAAVRRYAGHRRGHHVGHGHRRPAARRHHADPRAGR